MCGISGAFSFASHADVPEVEVISRLNEAQRFRGPDGEGIWSSGDHRVVLGHRRLAIIETGDAGAEPMLDITGRWVVTFNGEIYNYRELRAELEQCGRKFAARSDTEVLINAIAEWGEEGLRRLRGMFAFALWDNLERELWLARDPYGIKPLYFSEKDGVVWFASQARALARVAPVNINRDPAGLTGFYLWGNVPEPFTWWKGIKSFPAGNVLRIKSDSEVEAPRKFASVESGYLDGSGERPGSQSLSEAVSDSVRCHLIADVPVGMFLSSGVDSAAIAAIATAQGAKLKTVTVAFDEFRGTPDDEAPLAEEIARRLGTDHTTVRVDRATFERLADDFIASMDQPTVDGFNTYLVSWAAASQGLKVALSGLGGDELFGGYPSFRQIPKLISLARYVPLRGAVQRLVSFSQSALPGLLPPKVRGLLDLSRDVPGAYFLRRGLFLESELNILIDESVINEGLQALATHSSLHESVAEMVDAGASIHGQISALESLWYMRNQLLRDADWASMRFGVEVRFPLVDHALLNEIGPGIASSRPPGKADLLNCAAHLLPAEVGRRAKTGFVTPLFRWAAERPDEIPSARTWARHVHRRFRTDEKREPIEPRSALDGFDFTEVESRAASFRAA